MKPNLKATAALLSGSSLFCEMTESEREELATHAVIRPVIAKQIIVNQGQSGDEMYAVIHGRLKVSCSNREGREITLAILEAGEVFGELAMLDGAPRTANVEALENGQLLVLHRNAVDQYLAHHPHVMRSLITMLSERLRNADALVQDTLFLPLPQRLAKVLRQLAHNHGDKNADGVRIDLKMTQQDLANMIGTSRESVNKQLSQWEEQGLLKMKSGYLQIIHIEQLPQ